MQFLIILLLLIIMDLTRPVPKPPRRPGLGEFTAPTAEQDRRIPVFWGSPYLVSPNLVWYGDLRTTKIKQKIKGLFKDKKAVVGYRYYLGMHLIFGYGGQDTRLREIWIGGTNGASGADKVWSGNLGEGASSIEKLGLWGGDEEGGGISGRFNFFPGGPSQGRSGYLITKLGRKVPSYRGVCGIVWNGGYHGNRTVIQQWAARIENLPNKLGTPYSNINGEANAAEMQYDLLTNSDYGMGLTAEEIDLESFRKVAKTLHEEGHGLSLVWDNVKSLEEMQKEIDRHVDALTYINPLNGLRTMRLIRDDYRDLPLRRANKRNARLIKFSRPSADELVNEMIVNFASEEYQGKVLPVRVQDPAAFQNRDNQRVSASQSYPGITKLELAKRVCTRDLRALNYPFARVQLQLSREFYDLQPVDRILLDWDFPDGGVEGLTLIVLERDLGDPLTGAITVTAVQDTFGLGSTLYTEGGNSGWIPVGREPIPASVYRMEFTPWWVLKQDAGVPSPLAAVPMLMVEEPSPAHLSYSVHYNDPELGSSWAESSDTLSFTPTATLVYDYLESVGADTAGTLIVTDLKGIVEIPAAASVDDLRNLGEGLVVIGSEILGFTSAQERADGTWAVTGVQRALLDSVMGRHLAGSKVWFIGEALGRTPTQLLPFKAGTYRAKIISNALGGVLEADAAPTLSISTNATTQNARPLYAYPPRQLAINGSVVPGLVSSELISLTWLHANKEAETAIAFQAEGGTKPGDVHYIAYLFDDSGNLKAQSGNIYANSYQFSVGDVIGGLPSAGYVQVAAVNSVGASARATLWFGRAVDYANTTDAAPQRLLDEASPWCFTRMAD